MRLLGGSCALDSEAPATVTILWYLYFNLFHCALLYFLFGALECYRSVNHIWKNGLVLDNYHGIIDLICQPLMVEAIVEAPRDVAQLSLKRQSQEKSSSWLDEFDRRSSNIAHLTQHTTPEENDEHL